MQPPERRSSRFSAAVRATRSMEQTTPERNGAAAATGAAGHERSDTTMVVPATISATASFSSRAPQKPVLTMASGVQLPAAASTAAAARFRPTPLAANTASCPPMRPARAQSTASGSGRTSRAWRQDAAELHWIGCHEQEPHLSGGDADGTAAPLEPPDGASQRSARGPGLEAQFAARFFVRHPHLLPCHADGIDRHARRRTGQFRPMPCCRRRRTTRLRTAVSSAGALRPVISASCTRICARVRFSEPRI